MLMNCPSRVFSSHSCTVAPGGIALIERVNMSAFLLSVFAASVIGSCLCLGLGAGRCHHHRPRRHLPGAAGRGRQPCCRIGTTSASASAGLPQKVAQSSISRRRFSSASPREYAASVLLFRVCASAASASSRG